MSAHDRSQFRGYTLIELIGAMTAASLLMLTLASSVMISTSLIESDGTSDQLRRDQLILDRLGSDLRYATSINTKDAIGGFGTERVTLQNTPQSITYRSLADGLVRVADGVQVQLDQESPTIRHWVDGYTAATLPAQPNYTRPRACETASTTSASNSLAVDIPPEAHNGDLLFLFVAFRQTDRVPVVSSSWGQIASIDQETVRLTVYSQVKHSGTASTQQVTFDQQVDAIAAVVAIESLSGLAVTWNGSNKGTATFGAPSTYAVPIENPATIQPTSLNLQIFAADGSPWPEQTLAIPAFADLGGQIGSEGSLNEVMMGITYRSGAIPSVAHSVNAYHTHGGNWVSVSLQIDGA